MSRLAPARLITSCLGCGFLRPGPGTMGSLFGVGVYAWLLADLPLSGRVLAAAVATVVGVWASTAVARQLGDGDPSEVVVDELAGTWIALLGTTNPWGWLVAFLAFRVFDIAKPFPVNTAEGLPEGWGIMADDVVAGFYALLVVWIVGGWVAL